MGPHPPPRRSTQAQEIISDRVNGLGCRGIGSHHRRQQSGHHGAGQRQQRGSQPGPDRALVHPSRRPCDAAAGRAARDRGPAGCTAGRAARGSRRIPGMPPIAPAEPGAPIAPPAAGDQPPAPPTEPPAPQPRPYPQEPPPTPAPPPTPGPTAGHAGAPAATPPAKPNPGGVAAGAAHRRREAAAAEHRPADPDSGAAVPGHPLRRGRRAGRQRRPEPAADHLLVRTASRCTCWTSRSSAANRSRTPRRAWINSRASTSWMFSSRAKAPRSGRTSPPPTSAPRPPSCWTPRWSARRRSRSHPRRTHPDHRPVHRDHGARTGQRAQVRFAAAVVRVVGGRNRFRHTGFVISAGGLDRRCDRPRGGAAVLTALLPRARVAGRTVVGRFRRNGFRDTGAARQIHQLHVGPRGHRRA